MTSSVQNSDSLFRRDSDFLGGVGEVNAQASKNLNSASGWHLPSQRFPLPHLLPRWPLGAGGSDTGMEPWSGCCSLVDLSSAIFAVTSVLAASAPEAHLWWLDLLVCPWPQGLGILHWCWLVHRCRRPSGHSYLIPVLCPLLQELSFKNILFCSNSILRVKVWE